MGKSRKKHFKTVNASAMKLTLLHEMQHYFNSILTGDIQWQESTRIHLEQLLSQARLHLAQSATELPSPPTKPVYPNWETIQKKSKDPAYRNKILHLITLKNKLGKNKSLLNDIRKNAKAFPGISAKKIRKKIKALEQQIQKEMHIVLHAEMADYAKQNAIYQYNPAKSKYLMEQHDNKSKVQILADAIEKYITAHEHDFESGLRIQHVAWKFLPKGHWTFADLIAQIPRLRIKFPQLEWEEERLLFVRTFMPVECYVGSHEFDGYFAFTFSNTEKVLLENPIRGNAAYIIARNWKSLCQLTKSELLSQYRKDVDRVIHKGDWRYRLKILLS